MRRRCCQPPLLPMPLGGSATPSARSPAPGLPPIQREPGEPAAARRILALHLPRFAAEGFGRTPLAVWRAEGGRRVVCATDAGAEQLGIRIGQPLADAQAIAPGLYTEPETPERHAERLRSLALWALRFTPLAAPEPPDGLLLDITGCAHLAGGEAALLALAVRGLAALGHEARGAVAGTPEAAAALARAGIGAVVGPGDEAAWLSPLPPAVLRLPEETVAGLHKVGLRSIGALLAQPRGPLAKRFGAELLARLDAALGRRPTPIRPIRTLPEHAVARDLPEPIMSREAIDAVVADLLPALCAALERTGIGLRRLLLQAHRVDGAVQEIVIGTGTPTRDGRHLWRLLTPRLERLEPGFGFDRLALFADRTAPLAPHQQGIGTPSEALAALLDRLSQRVALWRPQPRSGHWPERAIERVSAFRRIETPAAWPGRPRPVRLLRRPERIEALALLPDAPPRRIRWRRAWREVEAAEGPERIEPEWWRDRPDHPARDYYRVACAGGVRLWICRVSAGGERRWYLHGIEA